MLIIPGKTASKGIAIGYVKVWESEEFHIEKKKAVDIEQEILRISHAQKLAGEELELLSCEIRKTVGEDGAQILTVHKLLLEEESIFHAACDIIRKEQVNGEYAIARAGEESAGLLEDAEDEYIRARAIDIRDVTHRMLRLLQNESQKPDRLCLTEPVILAAQDLAPSDILQLDRSKILAIITQRGASYSHTAILTRMMNIPMVIGVSVSPDELKTGTLVIVDGDAGQVILEPNHDDCKQYAMRIHQEEEQTKLLKELIEKENIKDDVSRMSIMANVGNISDIRLANENAAGGIGLFRSEFLFMQRKEPPTEEEQFQVYKQAAELMPGKKVVIRTLDMGADKKVPYLDFGREPNPALGHRGIRICLKYPQILKTQLRALFRAAAYGNLAVMYPMITSVEEVTKIRLLSDRVCEELKQENISYRIPKQGIMIETPAAVMISDKLAESADFFSIGTNDLTQYVLAVDRQNNDLGEFYDPHHEAIMKMLEIVVQNAHSHGITVGICGELAADTELTAQFLRMGIDELSVAPAMILKLRKALQQLH